jgi:hypothetical protein
LLKPATRRGKSRSPATGGGGNTVELLEKLRSHILRGRMEQLVRRCMAYMSDMNVPQVLNHAYFRHVGMQKSILDRANLYYTIKCLLNVHRGELREWSGCWELESHILNLLEVKWHMI